MFASSQYIGQYGYFETFGRNMNKFIVSSRIVAVLLISATFCANADSASDIQELRTQLNAMADQLKETQGQLKSVQGQLDSVISGNRETSLDSGIMIARTDDRLEAAEATSEETPITKLFKTRYYAGGGVGVSMLDLSENDVRSEITTARLKDNRIEIDATDYSFKVFAGIRPSKYWGVELGYARLGRYKVHSQNIPGGLFPPPTVMYDLKADPKAFYLDALGYLPLKTNLSLVGRLGAYRWENKLTATETGNGAGSNVWIRRGEEKDQGYSVKYGFGLQYDLDSEFSIRGDWERYMVGYKIDSTHIDMWTLSGVVNF